MASVNITSGRQSPVISELLIGAASGNAGRYIAGQLPCIFDLAPGKFKGTLRTLPVAQSYGDKRAVGTGALKRQSGASYYDLTRERAFDETSFEAVERAAAVFVDEQDELRTLDEEISGLKMRQSRAMQLITSILDDFEYDVLSALFSTATYPDAAVSALTGGVQVAWDTAGSSPAADFVAVENITRAACGDRPTFGVMSHDVLQSLRFNAETLNVKVVTSGAAPVARPIVKWSDVLEMWADRWELSDGLFVVDAMYNSANPGQSASLAEIISGKIAFHTSNGIKNASQVAENVDVIGGVQSFLVLREQGYRGYEDATINPHGVQLAGKHSYTTAAPVTGGAYILTAVNG